MALGGKLEPAHGFGPQLENVGLRAVVERHLHRPVLIGRVPRLEEFRRLGHLRRPEPAVGDVAVDLPAIGRAPAFGQAGLAQPPPGQRADTGPALVVGDVVGVVGIGLIAVLIDERGQPQPGAQIAQHRLEAPHFAVGLHHRPADRIGGQIGFADRTVEQRDAVVPLQIGRVRQDQVGIGHHFRRIGIRIDDPRDHVVSVGIRVGEHGHGLGRVHRRIPRHVGHVEHQRVDPVGIARMGIGDDHVHQPVGRHRVVPRKRLVDALGIARLVQQQVLGPVHKAEVRPVERLAGPVAGMGFRMRRHGFRIGRLEPHAARRLDRAQQDLQRVDRAGGLEAVGMGGNAPHPVHRHRSAHHLVVAMAPEIRPRLVDLDRFVKGDAGKVRRQ